MAEERISGVESVLAEIADKMGRKLDEHSATLAFQGQQLTEVSKKLDDQDIALYDQRAILAAHSRDLVDIKKRLERVESTMATKQDVAALDAKMDQVIALLTKPQH